MTIQGTQTEKNLLKAFAGESQARSRYTFFADQAQKEGMFAISRIFMETAENELEHARKFFSFLEGGNVIIEACYPAGVVGTTLENLKAAAMGENEEHTEIYPEFAKIAKEEGFSKVASAFNLIAKVEVEHELRYQSLIQHLENNTFYKRDKAIHWKCDKCGHIHDGSSAPGKCPVCLADQGWFIPSEL